MRKEGNGEGFEEGGGRREGGWGGGREGGREGGKCSIIPKDRRNWFVMRWRVGRS